MISTFDIGKEYLYLAEFMNEIDDETGEYVNSEDDLKSLIEEIDGKKSQKLENIEYLKRDIRGKSNTLDDEIKRLQERKKSFDNNVEKLTFLQNILLNGEKLKTEHFSFYYKTSESLKVPDEVNDADKEWVITTKKWDKAKIKKDLKESGIDYSELGFEFVEKQSVCVR